MSVSAASLNRISSLIYSTTGKQGSTSGLVKQAITTGFRAFDFTALPKDHAEGRLGIALREVLRNKELSRRQLWLQTNLVSRHDEDHALSDDSLVSRMRVSTDSCLQTLTFDNEKPYLDALLLQLSDHDHYITETVWQILVQYGPHTIRRLGLSNVSMEQVDELYQAVNIKPTIVRNRFCADNGYDQKLRLYCRDKGITYQCYGVLSDNNHLLESTSVRELSMKTGTRPEAAIYTLVALGLNVSVLHETTNVTRMKEHLAALDQVRSWRGSNRNQWMSLLSSFKGSLSRGRVL